MPKKIKLAEALLLRKQLAEKLQQLQPIRVDRLYEVKTTRKPAHEGVDDVIAQVPKVSMSQVTHAYDHHAKLMRQVDGAIQQCNWTTEVEVPEAALEDYVDPYQTDKKSK